MNKLSLAVATTAIGALSVGGAVVAQSAASAAPAVKGPLYTDNILTISDVKAGPLGAKVEGDVGADDLQYLISPCQQSSIREVTGGNTFSGDWYPKSGSAHEGETVSEVYNEPQAETAAKKILRWHGDNCNGDESDDLVTVGAHHRAKLAGGWSEWFTVTTNTADGQTLKDNIAVIRIDNRVALLGVTAKGATAGKVSAVVKTAAARLR